MKKGLFTLLFFYIVSLSQAQSTNNVINQKEVQRIETALSSNFMEGRKAFARGSEKAAAFISNEFKTTGLQTLTGADNYKQTFSIFSSQIISISASFDNKILDSNKIIVFSCKPELTITAKSGFKKIYINQAEELRKKINDFTKLKENLVVFLDTSLSQNFERIANRQQYLFKSNKTVVFVLGSFQANEFLIEAENRVTEKRGTNVIGVLPGKTKKDEFVIFSAHYDHLGIGEAVNNDSTFNGANDDASGVTAIISLAKFYKAAKNNNRTLIFVAFTAEEIGGYGSQYFSLQIDPQKVAAMFNIEMIGTESKWGKNSAYITGFEKSDMGKILQSNLSGSQFNFYPDPYPSQDLFYRSDNATLARLGVPAHTISTSKMDNEPNYHKLSDEVRTLDLENMTEIIRSIALSSETIVGGRETPTRVDAGGLTR